MKEQISVLIADDHELFRDGLALMLSRQPHLTLMGEVANGAELIAQVQQWQPQIVLTDVNMPVMGGVEAARIIVAQWPAVQIIALSMYNEEHLIVEMLEAGARGYLLKNADKHEILEAIESVHAGQHYYCRRTTGQLATLIAQSRSASRQPPPVSFSERETEIIRLICQQYTTQQIADKVFLSKRTVEGYRVKILEKMEVRNTAGIVVFALTHRLIAEEEIP